MATYGADTNDIDKAQTDARTAARADVNGKVASSALTGAGLGATIGTVAGPVGTAIGAVLGAGAGAIAGAIANGNEVQDQMKDAGGQVKDAAKSQMLADIDAAGTSRSMGVSPSQKTSLSIAQRSTSAAPSSAQKYMTPSPTPFDSWNAGTYGG